MFDIVMFGILGIVLGILSIYLHSEVADAGPAASSAAFFSGVSLTITILKFF